MFAPFFTNLNSAALAHTCKFPKRSFLVLLFILFCFAYMCGGVWSQFTISTSLRNTFTHTYIYFAWRYRERERERVNDRALAQESPCIILSKTKEMRFAKHFSNCNACVAASAHRSVCIGSRSYSLVLPALCSHACCCVYLTAAVTTCKNKMKYWKIWNLCCCSIIALHFLLYFWATYTDTHIRWYY